MALRWQLFTMLASSVALAACVGDVCEICGGGGGPTSTSANASSTGSACTNPGGELHGIVSASGMPSAEAIVTLRQKPEDVPLHTKADDKGAYSVVLLAGSWIVGGESADGYCTTMQPQTVQIEPCGTPELDVVLESCVL